MMGIISSIVKVPVKSIAPFLWWILGGDQKCYLVPNFQLKATTQIASRLGALLTFVVIVGFGRGGTQQKKQKKKKKKKKKTISDSTTHQHWIGEWGVK